MGGFWEIQSTSVTPLGTLIGKYCSTLCLGDRPGSVGFSELMVHSQLDVLKQQSPALVREPLPARRRSLE